MAGRAGRDAAPAVRVRRATAADLPGLTDLYGRLPPEDRYRRFFSGGPPSASTLTDWLGREGNLVVVAEAGGRIVADAGVARSASGPDELGIAVDPEHRGWLGPHLLDLVLDLAGRAGADAVLAEVLATNGPMLGLLAARGAAILPSEDPAVVRLLLGTSGAVPGWGADPRGPRVLLELGAGGGGAAAALAGAGYEVALCRGPTRTARRSRRWRCPVLEGRPCPLVAGADAVVLAPPATRDGPDAAVAAALPRVHPGSVLVTVRQPAPPADVVAAVRGRLGPEAVPPPGPPPPPPRPLPDPEEDPAPVEPDDALQAVRAALAAVAPDADLDTLADDEPLRDALELDSMDFLALVTEIHDRTGVDIPERDYPLVATLAGFVDRLARPAPRPTTPSG